MKTTAAFALLESLFESTTAIGSRTLTVDAGSGPTRAPVSFVAPGFFELLGRPVRHGRGFEAPDFAEGAVPVAILSDQFWQNDLNGSSDILGRTIVIGGTDAIVIGIAQPGVIGTRLDIAAAAFLPLPQVETAPANLPQRIVPPDGTRAPWLEILGRVHPADSLPSLERRLRADHGLSFILLRDLVVPFTSSVELVGATRLFLIASLAFLVLGATTFAMVALLHLESRRSEWATRLALGAHRWQIATTASAEVLVIAILAVALAFPMMAFATYVFRGVLLPGQFAAGSLGLTLDGPGMLFAALAGLLATALVTAASGSGSPHRCAGTTSDSPVLPGSRSACAAAS